jgi:hypothetical protein
MEARVSATDIPAGLIFETPPEFPETVNFLLYGPPKTGKSSTAATAPGPNLWVNAEGPGALAYARKIAAQRGNEILEVRITRQSDARQVLRDVIKHVRDRVEPVPATVTVDTIAKVREALIRQIVVPGAKNSIQQFGEVARILREFVQTMRDLPVNLVLIAHQNVEDAEGERIVRPLIGGALTEEIPGEVDVIAYTHSFKDDDTGERRYVGQLVEAKGRIAGDRSGGLGAVRDLDLAEWLSAYQQALAPTADLPWGDGPAEGESLEEFAERVGEPVDETPAPEVPS